MVGTLNPLGCKISCTHTLVVNNMVDFGNRKYCRERHMQTLPRALTSVSKTITKQISKTCMIPRGIKITHQNIRFIIAIML